MPRADRRYTLGLMERLERTIPNTEGRTWHLEHGSTTYGRWWRVCERDDPSGGHHADIAAGATEYDMQRALAHYLDGYSAGQRSAWSDAAHTAALALVETVTLWEDDESGMDSSDFITDCERIAAEFKDATR